MCGCHTTQSLCSVTGCKLGPLIANCYSVILIVLVCQRRVLGFESPLCQYQTHKVAIGETWGLSPDLVVEVCKGTTSWASWSRHHCMQFIHFEHVFNRWRVSHGGESSPQSPLVELSIKNSLTLFHIQLQVLAFQGL